MRSIEAVQARCRLCHRAAERLGRAWSEPSKRSWNENEEQRRRRWMEEARRRIAVEDRSRRRKSVKTMRHTEL
jgi:hypothetical protein